MGRNNAKRKLIPISRVELKWFLNFLIGNLRAYGGCLDSKEVMKDVAWRRYASGRCLAIFDPKMSEWGNPVSFDITLGLT